MNVRSFKHLIGGGGKLHRVALPAAAMLVIVVATALAGCDQQQVTVFPVVRCGPGAPPFPIPQLIRSCRYGPGIAWSESVTSSEIAQIVNSLSAEFATENVVMTGGTYSDTLSLYDQSGNLLSSYNASIYVSGNTAYLSNPGAVAAWAETYAATARSLKSKAYISYAPTDPDANDGQVTGTTYVDNELVGAASSFFSIHPPECHHTSGGRKCKPATY